MDKQKMFWKVHVSKLFEEIIKSNESAQILRQPLNILKDILAEVGNRASELNDPKLNALMCRLAIYSISDPTSEDYNYELTEKIISEAYRING